MTASAIVRGVRQSAVVRPLAQSASFRPSAGATLQQRTFAESKKSGAEPKILKDERPDDSKVTDEVRKHNEEVERRTQTQEQSKQGDKEKDKVPKGYWGGSKVHPCCSSRW